MERTHPTHPARSPNVSQTRLTVSATRGCLAYGGHLGFRGFGLSGGGGLSRGRRLIERADQRAGSAEERARAMACVPGVGNASMALLSAGYIKRASSSCAKLADMCRE